MDKITIELDTWQRVQMRSMFLIQPIGPTYQQGNWGSDFLELLELSDEEKRLIDFESIGSGGKWSIDKDRTWQIEFECDCLLFAFGRLLDPRAQGWSYDKKRNQSMHAKMEAVLEEIRNERLEK